MTKRKKITLITISCILIAIIGFAIFWYFGANYPYYDKYSKNEFNIPALGEGFIPQGLCFDEGSNTFLVSGYMNDKNKPSRIYFIDDAGVKYITLSINGEGYFDHAGGVSLYGNIIYVVGDHKLNLINKQTAYSAENLAVIEIQTQLQMPNGADCITTTANGELWVGEFYRKGNYSTQETHHFTAPDGSQNMAVSYCFSINENGLLSTIPTKGLSTTGLVQGIDFTANGDIILSTSYSLPSSNLYYHTNPFTSTSTYIEIEQTQVPIYILDSSNLIKKIEAPCMSEEICIVKEKVYILYESACAKYKMFTRRRITKVQSLPLEVFTQSD